MKLRVPSDFFFKGHGLGNDYFVLKQGRIGFRLTPYAIRLLCDRHKGIGSDGILLHVKSAKADAGLRIYNPDGSEAQKSGNGARIFALYLSRYGLPGRKSYSIETPGGMIRAKLENGLITVDMGRVSFKSKDLPMRGRNREAVMEKLRIGSSVVRFTGLSVGNPHAVIFVNSLSRPQALRLGPKIENNPLFPERTNVQFAKVVSRSRIKALIWERGAGETLASGSSACAVAAAARKLGYARPDVSIEMQGGTLRISIDPDWNLTMTGPAVEVAAGIISNDLVRRLKSSAQAS